MGGRHAQRAFDDMGRSLRPPENTAVNVALESSGAILDTGWQDSFYGHVGSFLAKVRSVPSIIESCFGADRGSRSMRDWFDALWVNSPSAGSPCFPAS